MGKTSRLNHLVVANSLLRSRIFAGLSSAGIAEISGFSTVRNLEKGEYLFREGEPCEGFFVVQRGVIGVQRVSAAGKVQIIHVFHSGDSFAEPALVSGEGYPADARALASSAVILVPRAEFVALLRKRPELALRMLASMSQHLRGVVALLDDLTLKNAEARCIHWLLRQCPVPHENIPFEIELEHPKRIVAAELNITSETLSRMLTSLRGKQLIRTSGKTIVVLNPLRLETFMRKLLGEALEHAPGQMNHAASSSAPSST
jgi:CRP/FNR family transcriptional regulator, dissimilatory nitrate respiration regulator